MIFRYGSSALMFVSAVCLAGSAGAGETTDYQALVQKGSAELKADDNTSALVDASSAIAIDPGRWEGYALAGGALSNLGRYKEAADDFTMAINHAPGDKLAALGELRQKSLQQAQSGIGSSANLVNSIWVGDLSDKQILDIGAGIRRSTKFLVVFNTPTTFLWSRSCDDDCIADAHKLSLSSFAQKYLNNPTANLGLWQGTWALKGNSIALVTGGIYPPESSSECPIIPYTFQGMFTETSIQGTEYQQDYASSEFFGWACAETRGQFTLRKVNG